MPVIAISIEPCRVIRIFFDCRDVPTDHADLRRIERAVEDAYAIAEAAEEASGTAGAITDRISPARLELVTYRALWSGSARLARRSAESGDAESN